jgi:anti-sigma factor RsiW
MDRHSRFEQLALSHVLGGIDRGDADDFRTHLRACPDCRARVAELRGISSSLDAAAREERRRAAEGGAPERRDPSPQSTVRRGPSRTGVVLVALALVLGFAFWNLHLRTSADAYLAAAEDRGAILRDLAIGTLVDDPSLDLVAARVATSGTRIALVIADGGPLGSDERLVAWLTPIGSSTDEAVVLAVGPAASTEVAVRIQRGSATHLVVTRERGLLSSSGPRGAEVLRVALPSLIPGT